MPRAIALAVDGMEPTLLRRWIDSGDLPNFAAAVDEGAMGTATCSSLSSAKQWTGHFTGVDADRHGVTGFTRSDSNRRAGDSAPDARELINVGDIEVKTYPELLSERGRAVGLINPLPLWPPLELENGFCISGMLTPPGSDRVVHPRSMRSELEEYDYEIDVRYGSRPYGFVDDALFGEVPMETLHEDMFRVMDRRLAFTRHAVEAHDTDLLYALLKSVDIIQHAFWIHMAKDDPTYGDAILDSYRRVDELIGWLRDRTDANVLVFSDHGFKARPTDPPGPVDAVARYVADSVPVPSPVQRLYDAVFRRDASSSVDVANPERTTGVHADPAVWVAFGPDVDHTAAVADACFEDFTPTLYAMLDEPIPQAYVGEPLSVVSRPVETVDSDISVSRRVNLAAGEVVSERLHNLGYADMVDDS